MLDITKDIQSLTTFRRRSGEFLRQLKKSKRPVVLTVKGKVAAVVQDAEAYQRLLDTAAQADAEEGIRQGLEDVREGEVRPARAFFDEFEVRRRERRRCTLKRALREEFSFFEVADFGGEAGGVGVVGDHDDGFAVIAVEFRQDGQDFFG